MNCRTARSSRWGWDYRSSLSFLANKTHAPNMTILFELGVIDPEPIHTGVGLADPRVWYRAKVLSSFVDILGTVLHKGRVDVGFLGGLEIDQYGNLEYDPGRRPAWAVPAHDRQRRRKRYRSCAKKTIIIMRHEARKLKQAISFYHQPRAMSRGGQPEQAGLHGGPSRVITDKAIFGFDPVTDK